MRVERAKKCTNALEYIDTPHHQGTNKTQPINVFGKVQYKMYQLRRVCEWVQMQNDISVACEDQPANASIELCQPNQCFLIYNFLFFFIFGFKWLFTLPPFAVGDFGRIATFLFCRFRTESANFHLLMFLSLSLSNIIMSLFPI